MFLNRSTAKYLSAAQELRSNGPQWAAYESTGHCVVLAGPGSGKTKVLITKLSRMLSEDVRPPRGIACITFNNQCVDELKKRLSKLGIGEGFRVFVGTVHSFCLREVIAPYSKLAQMDLPLKVASSTEQQRIFADAVTNTLGNRNPQSLRTLFDEFRRTILDRASLEWTTNEYSSLVIEYERLLKEASNIDFDGMILKGLELIKNHYWVRKALKAKYPILVVDEYQDLGIPLHEIVKSLCFDGKIRLFAVGDPDQSIYGFTGARPALMNELLDQDGVESIRLQLNYRCGKSIIVASTMALAEPRAFEPAGEHQGVVQDYQCKDGFKQQIEIAIKEIVPEALKQRENRKLGDIGILYRDKYEGEAIAKAVETARIEYVRFDQGNPYRRSPIIYWLENCAIWCADGWKFGEPRLSDLIKGWLRFNSSLAKESHLHLCRRDLVRFLYTHRSPDMKLLSWLKELFNQGFFKKFKNDPIMEEEVESIELLYRACESENSLANYTIANFGGQKGSPNHLNLTTIHSAKGLEYDVVIMMGLEQGRIPYFNCSSDQEKEARRLFYVAMTRARHEVHLLWSGWYEQRGRRYSNGRSKFIDEIMSQLDETKQSTSSPPSANS